MDVILNNSKPITVEFVEKDNIINMSTGRKIDVVFKKPSVDINMSRANGPTIEAFANMIRGASVLRIKQADFDNLKSKKEDVWYFVTNITGSQVIKIYAGSTLFAKADKSGSIGFPYSFPITFGQ